MPPTERRYLILGLRLALRSSRAAFLELFDRDYGCFRSGARRARPDLSLSVRWGLAGSRLEIVRPDRAPELLDLPVSGPSLVFNLVQREVFRALPGYVFLHAAVLAKDGAALVVAGPSGSGKTTMLQALAKRGFAAYSDEFCPIRLDSGLVHPFPRAVWIRTKPGSESIRKRSLPAPDLLKHPRRPLPIRQIVFLGDADAHRGGAGAAAYLIIIRSDRAKAFLQAAQPAGVKKSKIRGSAYDRLTIRTAGDRGAYGRLLRALKVERDAVPLVHWLESRPAKFGAEAAQEGIAASEAAGLLLSNLIDNSNPWTLDKPGAAFFWTHGLLRKVDRRRVIPGPPASTADLIAVAWEKGAGGPPGSGRP